MNDLYDAPSLEHLASGLSALLGHWGLPASGRVSLLAVSENVTFRYTDATGQATHVLRVYRPGHHTEREIESELAWIEALRSEAIVSTPRPLDTIGGGKIVQLADGDDSRWVVAFEFMRGHELAVDGNLISAFRQLGSITAGLHRHARQWSRPDPFQRKVWDFDTTIGASPHWGHWRQCPDLTLEAEVMLNELCSILQARTTAYGKGNERFGLIHADLRLAKLLVDGERLSVVGFDHCGIGWYAYDFAAAISFIEEDAQVPAMLTAWLDGYRAVSPLSDADEAEMPTFIMLRRLMLTAWLATHAETPTAHEMNPGFLDGTLRMAQHMLDTGSPLGG